MLKIYSYSGCSTCKSALRFLADRKLAYEVVAIRESPPTKTELRRMLAVYEGELRKLFNTSGQEYRALGLGKKLETMTVDEALDLLAKNGNLVKRPFVVAKGGGEIREGWVGFKAEDWERWVGRS
jgi:arsenate reductase